MDLLTSDAAIAEIERRLSAWWVLNSITITEIDDYSVLLYPRGPVRVAELGRVYGRGRTIREALNDALGSSMLTSSRVRSDCV